MGAGELRVPPDALRSVTAGAPGRWRTHVFSTARFNMCSFVRSSADSLFSLRRSVGVTANLPDTLLLGYSRNLFVVCEMYAYAR